MRTKRIAIGGQEIGIERLDHIMDEVRALGLVDDAAVTGELLRRTKVYNYVPTKRSAEYGEALLREYKNRGE